MLFFVFFFWFLAILSPHPTFFLDAVLSADSSRQALVWIRPLVLDSY